MSDKVAQHVAWEAWFRDVVDKTSDDHIQLIECYVCNVWHWYWPDSYQVCFECKHVYQTKEDLEAKYKRVVTEMFESDSDLEGHPALTLREAEEIYFCQHCVHDFVFPSKEGHYEESEATAGRAQASGSGEPSLA